MDDIDAAVASVLDDCKNADDMERYIGRFAGILRHLVCCKAKEANQTEADIRASYSTWADMAVEQFADRSGLPCKKPH